MDKAVGILGIGTFLPPAIRGNDFWPKDWKPLEERTRRRDMLAVERSTNGSSPPLPAEIVAALAALGDDPFRGARFRRFLDDGADVSDMEAEAVRRALRSSGTQPDEIDLVLVSSLVSDYVMPGNGAALQAKCELSNAAALAIEPGGCAGFQPQMVMAAALVRTGVYRRVLCVLSSAASRILDYTTPMSTTFGDGAAAAVVGEVPAGRGLIGHWMRTAGNLRDGVVYVPVIDGKPRRKWHAEPGPIKITALDADATKEAGRRGPEYCREACLGALAAAGLSMSDVKLYVGNQSLGWFVDACRRALGLPAEKTIDTFAEIGSIGPASVLYNLDRAHRDGRLEDGDVVLIYSPGAGLIRTAAVYRWTPAGISEP